MNSILMNELFFDFSDKNVAMDLDPMVSSSQEDCFYSDYDDRPIRPMNQEALNETLARLPILIDEEDYNNRTNGSSDSNTRF